MSTVFVTGGTGLTGANVCEQLIGRGDRVRALVRNPDDAEALDAMGVELIQGDIADAGDVLGAAKGCEASIHTAALVVRVGTSRTSTPSTWSAPPASWTPAGPWT